jgi:two-component system cell cycle sensor histidine kinase/response regulator CckA
VILAETGMEALNVLARDHTPVHLILTDVVMPGMNGRELLTKVSEAYPHMRGLLMSGYNKDIVAHRGALDEGVDFLQKPFTLEALARKVRETLDA